LSLATARFAHVARLNEGRKTLTATSLRVNLLALDAMVQSRRAGGSLRGFDEVSSQMRTWTLELVGGLEELGRLNRDVLVLLSLVQKEQRSLDLLEAAAARGTSAAMEAALERQRAAQEARSEELRRAWRKLVNGLEDLDLLGMMASVLSRAAMIEAASGNADQRQQLGAVSEEFHHNADEVMRLLKELLRGARRGN
jgi:hypothetical protein